MQQANNRQMKDIRDALKLKDFIGSHHDVTDSPEHLFSHPLHDLDASCQY